MNQTYGTDKVAFSEYLKEVRAELKKDTVKKIDEKGNIILTLNRDELVTVQTPQVFKADWYKKAILAEESSSAAITDDNMLMENMGYAVHCTFTGAKNIKITVPDDIAYANFLLNGDKKYV